LIGFIAAADDERTTGCLWLREHLGDGDSTGHMALDDELHRVSDSQDCGGRIRAPGRFGMAFELTIDQVDDPVGGNSCPGVDRALLSPIPEQAALRDLDDEGNVSRAGMTVLIEVIVPPHHDDIRLRFIVVRDPHGLLLRTCHPGGIRRSIMRSHLRDTVECFGFLGIFHTMTPLRSSIGSSSPSNPDSTIRSYRSTVMRNTSSGAGNGKENAGCVGAIVDIAFAPL